MPLVSSFHQTRGYYFLWSETHSGAFWQTPACCNVPFSEEWLLSGHSTINAWLMEFSSHGCPSPISTKELWISFIHSDHWVPAYYLPVRPKALCARLLRLAGGPDLGRLLVLNYFHLRMMEATVFLCTFTATEMFLYPSPNLCLDTFLSGGTGVLWIWCGVRVVFWCSSDQSAAVLLCPTETLNQGRVISFLCRFRKGHPYFYLLWTRLLQSTLFLISTSETTNDCIFYKTLLPVF